MRVGIALPGHLSPASGGHAGTSLALWAEAAEALGFDSIWVPDRRPGADGPAATSGLALDALASLGALARLTRSARIGVLAMCTPARAPSIAARALAAVDVLSGGRLTVALEPCDGYVPPPPPPEGPGGYLAEAVEILRGMFGGEPFYYQGRHWRVDGARCAPRPVQRPGPPVWVGGAGDEVLEVAARLADGWVVTGVARADRFRERSSALDRACREAGRDPGSVARSLVMAMLAGATEQDVRERYDRLRGGASSGLGAQVTLGEWRRGKLVGPVGEVAAQVRELAAAGVTDLVVDATVSPLASAQPDDLAPIAAACSL